MTPTFHLVPGPDPTAERFRKVFEEAPIGMAILSEDLRFTAVNTVLCRMIGYTGDQMMQRTVCDIVRPEDLPLLAEGLRGMFRGKAPGFEGRIRCTGKKGTPLWVHWSSSEIRGDGTREPYGFCTIEDITEYESLTQFQPKE